MLVDRQLMLAEVERFTPPEPSAADIAGEVDAMTARAGERLAAVTEETGVDQARIRELARESLRIQGYLNQRFGTTTLLSEEEVLQYYRIHPEEFTQNGRLIPFGEAEPTARQRAAAERRASTIASVAARLAESCGDRDRQGIGRSGNHVPTIATRSTSSPLKPAWLTIGATLLPRRRYNTAQKAPRSPVVTTASQPCM